MSGGGEGGGGVSGGGEGGGDVGGGGVGGGRGGKMTTASATLSALSLTPSEEASDELIAAAARVEFVTAAASAAPPAISTAIDALDDVTTGDATDTGTPSALPRALVSVAVSSSAAVELASRLSAAPRGTETTKVTADVESCLRRLAVEMVTSQPTGSPAHT